MYTMVLLASGTGSRMGHELPKQFIEIDGKPIIIHTIENFMNLKQITEIIIVSASEQHSYLQKLLTIHLPALQYKLVAGGKERQDSTYEGLRNASNDYILIHEAARPFVYPSDFQNMMDMPTNAVTFGAPIPFTVLQGKGEVESILDRNNLINVQLPQKFNRMLLFKAMSEAQKNKHYFTEEASLFKYYLPDIPISILPGKQENIKITYPIDLLLAKELIKTFKVLED